MTNWVLLEPLTLQLKAFGSLSGTAENVQLVLYHLLYRFSAGAKIFSWVEFAGFFGEDLPDFCRQGKSKVCVDIYFAHRHFCGFADST